MEGFPCCCTLGAILHIVHNCLLPLLYTAQMHATQQSLHNFTVNTALYWTPLHCMLHSACTDCSVEEAAHKEAFSLLSPLTLPLLPASLLHQTSLAFHCTAFQCITDHFTEFQSTELHFMSINCIVDFLGIEYTAAAAKHHMHFKAQYTQYGARRWVLLFTSS